MQQTVCRCTLAGLTAIALTLSPAQAQTAWGTYLKPFAATSPWNSRPVNPVFSNFVLPPSANPAYRPSIDDGPYSLGVFKGTASDPAVTVYGISGQSGVSDPDNGIYRSVTIPHWPSTVAPASGSDGHADIVDETTGVVHSFWQLHKTNGVWTASSYGWSRITGQGFGDPAHWYQGVRATGVPGMGGLIRLNEISDGKPYYEHALAMSLQSIALAGGSGTAAYIAPATIADYSASTNTGKIPEGSLLMLPPSFDLNTITDPALRKIAQTLKLYGAYVVDRNSDTAYTIYVENGANFSLPYTTSVNNQLEAIRLALRKVEYAGSWLDGNGYTKPSPPAPNILSYRGSWGTLQGPAIGHYDMQQQAVVFPYTDKPSIMVNYSNTGLTNVNWAKPAPGTVMRFTATATGGASTRLQVRTGYNTVFDSGYLKSGSSATFTWPTSSSTQPLVITLYAQSGIGTASAVHGWLTRN